MVRIFSMYHFDGQMVDTVDDMSTLTVTNHNKLLIAQDDYSVEVKDLLSDQKKPIFVFSTVEKVHKICHCAHGNYVATVEGKQEFQKSDRLIIRVYTNWELNLTDNESKKSKRFVRARIAGVVSPSSSITDEDFLDMIEIPISFTSPTILTVCQSTGKLLITCGPTMHLFYQIYTRSNHGKTSYFMDFLPFVEVFQLDFIPIEVIMSENIIASYSQDFVSVFKVKKLSKNELEKLSRTIYADCGLSRTGELTNSVNAPKSIPPKSLDITNLLKMVRENQEDQIVKFIDSRSLPLMVTLKGINDSIISVRAKKLPFKFFEKKSDWQYKNGKIRDTLVETLCDKGLSVAAESILALHIQDPDELITKVALQVLYRPNADNDDADQQNNDTLTQDNSQFVSLCILVSTYQEGYLFYSSTTDFQESLRCVAVFNFTSQVISLMFEACFLHVLTQTGLETYNLPSLRATVLRENLNLDKFSQYISIIGMHPFMGIVDFIGSKDLIVILTSASEGKRGKESLPWTVYSLKKPKLFEVYKEMIENSNSFKSRDDSTYHYLSLESFLILQMGLDMNLNVCNDIDDTLVRSTHRINSLELAKIHFRSGKDNDVQIGSSVILAAKIDLIDFIRSIELEHCDISNGKIYLMKKWIQLQNQLSVDQVEWLINMFEESNDIIELSSLLLSNKSICRTSGRKAIPCLKAHVAAKKENSDVQVIYILAILYAQECLQNEAVKVLSYVSVGDLTYRKSFVSVVLKFWNFLFDEISNYGKDKVVLSGLSSLLCENLPTEMGEILGELVINETVFDVSHVVQMLMMQFPCHVSVQKSTLILRKVLEKVFSSNIQLDYNDSNIKNCVKILARSYLTELAKENVVVHEVSVNDSRSTFVEILPSYVDNLPAVSNVNYATLRRFQELIWNEKLDEESAKEIIDSISHVNLKLNLLAMLNDPEFAKDLIEHKCFDTLLPYVKCSFHSVEKWRDFISFIQQKIREQNERGEDSGPCEKILKDILNHLAMNLNPSQLNAVLESTIPKEDELYWHSMVRVQQISYANEVKLMILNTSQQMLQSNSVN